METNNFHKKKESHNVEYDDEEFQEYQEYQDYKKAKNAYKNSVNNYKEISTLEEITEGVDNLHFM